MTLESTVNENKYTGNGATRSFAYTFRVWKKNEVAVWVGNGLTEQEVSSSCSISITATGGTVTFPTAPASGIKIVIRRNMPYIQEDDYRNGSRFDSEDVEDRFDQDCAERQDLRLELGRCLKLPITSSMTAEEFIQLLLQAMDALQEAGDITGASLVKASGSTTYRTLSERFADFINVKDYGAVGDGTTDDSAAILSAVAASGTMLDADGKSILRTPLFFPRGEYVITSSSLYQYKESFSGIGARIKWVGITETKVEEYPASSKYPAAGTTTAEHENGSITSVVTVSVSGDTATVTTVRTINEKQWVGWTVRGALNIDFDDTVVREGSRVDGVPFVRPEGLINLCNGQLMFWRDGDGDGDYDSELWSRSNFYMTAEAAIHLIPGNGAGRLVIRATQDDASGDTGIVRLQPSGDFAGNKTRKLIISPYRSSTPVLTVDPVDGYVGVRTAEPETFFHVNWGGALQKIALFSNNGTRSAIAFRDGGSSNDTANVSAGCAGDNFSVRATGGSVIYCGYGLDSDNDDDFSVYNHGIRTLWINAETLNVQPGTDGEQNLGSSAHRWAVVFAATGTINTSDIRFKTSIEEPSDALMRAWGKVGYKVFQFKDAVSEKGIDSARLHIGLIAQEVKEAFASEGLDASRYGLFCHDVWQDEYEEVAVVDSDAVLDKNGTVVTPPKTHVERRKIRDAGDRYGIRYEEALALECAYQRWRLEQIEERIEQLTSSNNS